LAGDAAAPVPSGATATTPNGVTWSAGATDRITPAAVPGSRNANARKAVTIIVGMRRMSFFMDW
jgi:hypothetical protein